MTKLQRRFEFKIGKEEWAIELTDHAIDGMKERNVANFAVFGCVVKLGEELTRRKTEQEFGIIDYDTNTAVVCDIHTFGSERLVSVITVIGGLKAEDLYITRGVHVYNVGQLLDDAIKRGINKPVVNITGGMRAPERILEKTHELLIMFDKTKKFCNTDYLRDEARRIESDAEQIMKGTFKSDREAEVAFEAFKTRTNAYIDKALGL